MKKIILFLSICFSIVLADPPDWQTIPGTQYSMVLIAGVELFDTSFEGEENNIVAAFGPGGENDCRSIATWIAANPPFDGYWNLTIVADINNEEISFKVYDTETDMVYNCGQTLTFINNETVGHPTNLFNLTIQNGIFSGLVSLITTILPAGNVEEVSLEIGDTVIFPETNGNFEYEITSGKYDITASLPGYQTAKIFDYEVMAEEEKENLDIFLIDWQPINGTQYSMVVMAKASIMGQDFEYNKCNQIAAFGPESDEDCRAIGVWQEPNPPDWEGHWYFTIRGNTIGQMIDFKILDGSTGEITNCYETVEFIDNTTIGSPQSPFLLSDGVFQQFTLNQNWNWLSFNIMPYQSSIDIVFNELGNSIFQIKSQDQSATFYSPPDVWVGDLEIISIGETYLLKMNTGGQILNIEGVLVDPAYPIEINQGWNWVAYLPREPKSLSNALTSILDEVFQVKSQYQSASYYDPPGNWVGDLEEMSPGMGYKIKIEEDCSLIYTNFENSKDILAKQSNSFDQPDWVKTGNFENNMVVMAKIIIDDIALENNDNIIAAFGPDSDDNNCRGFANWEEEVPGVWDGFWYFTIGGNIQNEVINFKVYDSAKDTIINCSQFIEFKKDTTYGMPDNPIVLSANTVGNREVGCKIRGFKLYQNFPNPFNPVTSIKFDIQKKSFIELKIFDLRGKLVNIIVNKRLSPGEYSFLWNGRDSQNKLVPSGIYFYQLSTQNFIGIKKMVLQK